MAKQRLYVAVENSDISLRLIVKQVIGLRPGIPWRELQHLSGYKLISYNSKGDYRGLRDHGTIEVNN